MTMYTLRNDFHDSEVRIRCDGLSHIHNECEIRPTKRQLQRIRRVLCGISDCECGSIRGPQRTDDGKLLIVDCTAEFTD